jgi:signal transduction histidine kinase
MSHLHTDSLGRSLWKAVWQTPIWALPFAIFFGTLFGGTFKGYLGAYKISLVFAVTIRIALIALEFGLRRRMKRRSLPIEIALIISTSILASYVAAYIVHRTLMPGILGSPQAFAINGMFAILFTVLIAGIAYAMHFYHESLARARAVEAIRAELAQAELRALKAQVQPHFLFNTLNSIAALIPSDPRAAEEMTTRLAEVFRYALSSSERETAPLSEELAFARGYLDIERARFGNRLSVVTEIEPGLEHIQVPSLLLQPVVENAVRHGIAPRAEGGTIRLTAAREGTRLRLTVEDDGPGIDPSAVARLSGASAEIARAPGGRGFGLFSVRERLRANGSEDALTIESPPGGGTRVSIRLPLSPVPTPRSSS